MLPEQVRAALVRCGDALATGGDLSGLLPAALAGIATLPPAQIARLDGEIARAATLGYQQHGGLRWLLAGMPSDTRRLLATPGLERLFLFHRDGRLREAALQRVSGGLDGPFGVAAVLWRLNDWVPQVRMAALSCARRTLPLTDGTVVANALAAVLVRQVSWGRWTDERAVLLDQLARPDVAMTIAQSIRVSASGAWVSVLRAAMPSPALDGELVRLVQEAAQPSVRAVALTALIDRTASWQAGWTWRWIDKSQGARRREPLIGHRPIFDCPARGRLVSIGVRDRSAVVRRAALAGVIRHLLGTGIGRAAAARLAADRSASVRAKAAFILGWQTGD